MRGGSGSKKWHHIFVGAIYGWPLIGFPCNLNYVYKIVEEYNPKKDWNMVMVFDNMKTWKNSINGNLVASLLRGNYLCGIYFSILFLDSKGYCRKTKWIVKTILNKFLLRESL